MAMLQPSRLKAQAQSRLERVSYNPKTLVLIHAGISLGASLLVSVLNFILESGIAGTGGLSGMGMRSALTSAQAILELAIQVLSPFWNLGLLFAALGWARGENATPTHLLQGFRRFPTVLGLYFVQGGIYIALGIAVSYISSLLLAFTPFAAPYMEQMEILYGSSAEITPEMLTDLKTAMTPLLILFGVLFTVVAIPVACRLRFAQYAVMEGGSTVQSIVHSVRITKGNVLKMIRLDLSFWWFYLLQALTVVLCYGDQILPALGIVLPFADEVSFFLFYVLGIVAQCILLWQYQANLSTAYCLAYRALSPQPEDAA